MSVSLDFAVEPNERPRPSAERAAVLADPSFGKFFTDHMVTIRYKGGGWQDGRVQAYAPIVLDPSTSVLHYGQAVFEGFKAYAQPDGSVATFRPWDNARRFARSAERLAMPALPADAFVEAADLLIRADRDWVPTGERDSLYIRPLMIATDPYIGVRPSETYDFLLFASPSGAYFPRGVAPVSVWVTEDYVRAAPGGTGAAKCAGNYAASLLAQREAHDNGCDQVVWLDAVTRRRVEEMGGMNLCFVYADGAGGRARLVTPELTGTLLPGITRDSLLTLARDRGLVAQECTITLDQWRADAASGRMTEAFACGTAAVITPIGEVKTSSGGWTMGDGEPGPVALELRQALVDIQRGRSPDAHGWMHPVE